MTASNTSTARVVSVDLIGRLWRDHHGNTYHAVRVVLTTDHGGVWSQSRYDSGVHYGYDNAYEQTAAKILARVIPSWFSGDKSARRACEARGVAYTSERVRVKRKRDLEF